MKSIVEQKYWDSGYERIELSIAPPEDGVRKWVEKYIPRGNGSCFEVGCFPGRYLAVFGEKGYELNGIDLTGRVEKDLPVWLKSQGFRIGSFEKRDFLKYRPNEKYDVVCSFGLIEHFINWPELIKKHLELVKDNGYLVISTPNFRGLVQRLLHRTLDEESFRRHLLDSMRPDVWADLAIEEGFNIVFKGYFGGFDFWFDAQHRNDLQNYWLGKLIENLPDLKRRWSKDRSIYSAYCGLIARRSSSKSD